ncbi:MAG: hypothetical protein H0W84_12790, partial [Bacteroidetes bacterium]|nr:hypothetical protein [Bacteroidota bacterium]
AGGGATIRGGGKIEEIVVPIYCLKKGDAPTILIVNWPVRHGGADYMKYQIGKEQIAYLITLINDYKELVKLVEPKQVLEFGEVEKVVKKYNEWAKNNR